MASVKDINYAFDNHEQLIYQQMNNQFSGMVQEMNNGLGTVLTSIVRNAEELEDFTKREFREIRLLLSEYLKQYFVSKFDGDSKPSFISETSSKQEYSYGAEYLKGQSVSSKIQNHDRTYNVNGLKGEPSDYLTTGSEIPHATDHVLEQPRNNSLDHTRTSYNKMFKSQTSNFPFRSNGSDEFNCDQCSFTATFKTSLTRHVKTIHSKIKDFQCIHCEYSTGVKSNLDRHLKTSHNNV